MRALRSLTICIVVPDAGLGRLGAGDQVDGAGERVGGRRGQGSRVPVARLEQLGNGAMWLGTQPLWDVGRVEAVNAEERNVLVLGVVIVGSTGEPGNSKQHAAESPALEHEHDADWSVKRRQGLVQGTDCSTLENETLWGAPDSWDCLAAWQLGILARWGSLSVLCRQASLLWQRELST